MATIESHEGKRTGEKGTAADFHRVLDATLRRRRARDGTRAAWLEDRSKTLGGKTWEFLKRHPFTGVALVGAAGIAAASAIGVGELAVGLGAATAAYKVFRKGEAPEEAIEELERTVR